MNLTRNPALIEQLAASYALGTLRGGARRRFETLARQDPAVRAAALIWQSRMASVSELQPEVAPSSAVWKRIENLVDGEKHAKAEAPKPPVFVVMEPFTVNLQNEGSEQFLQTAFTLQVANNEEVELLKVYMPQVRSRLLLLLSSKHASEINTPEGKKKLGTEIVASINQPFSAGGKKQEVSDVFFTSFVIQ